MAETKPAAPLFGEEPDDDSFWLKIMAECLENPVTKLPTGKRLLVLGDNEAEKTLLVTRLQGAHAKEGAPRCNGLEYRYLTVKDEYGDGHTKLGVWILDGDPFYEPLLKYALDGPALADTTVLLVASMTRPWDVLDTVAAWTDILRRHIEGLPLPPGELERRRARVLDRYREYVEPGLSLYGSLAADTTRELAVNLGVEVVVVVARTEYMRELQADFGYEEEHFDFMQLSLRDFCLSHGAALFYVSAREDKNCDLLLKYILHRAYAFPFRLPGVLVERDSILVPAGWDTRNKIRFLSDTLTTIPASTPYEEVVFRPARLSEGRRAAPEVSAQRDQEFLAEVQAALERQASEDRAQEAKEGSTATVVQRNVARRMTRAQPANRTSPQKKLEAKLASGEGDTTLSNFFHSLLNRRTSAPVDRPLGLSGARTFAPKGGSDALRGIEENHCGGDRKSSTDTDSEESDPRLRTAVSLDQEEEARRQLPEYFLSSPGVCAPDCSFQTDSSASSFDLDEPFSPPLDRVKSSFNPPLRLLLENAGAPMTNGEKEEAPCRAEAFEQK